MTIPVWMAGWSSNNKYALLGGMRAAAQAVSFEVPLLLSALVPVVLSGSFRIGDIVAAQADGRWFVWWPPGPGTIAFVLFLLTSLAEANRIPFDIPEAESELVAGINIVDLLVRCELKKSKGEARKLVEQGGAYVNNVRIGDVKHQVTTADLVGEQLMLVRGGKKDLRLVRAV